MIFLPVVDGRARIRSRPADFVAALARRVRDGLLAGGPHRRNHYEVVHEGADRLEVRATTLATAFNVGLNHIDLHVDADGVVRYVITYWRWASYAIGLGAIIGGTMGILFLIAGLREYLLHNPASQMPGLSLEANVAIAWTMIGFWGFLWPWILIELHKRPLRRLMEGILSDVDSPPR